MSNKILQVKIIESKHIESAVNGWIRDITRNISLKHNEIDVVDIDYHPSFNPGIPDKAVIKFRILDV